jgi:hypothetical protein
MPSTYSLGKSYTVSGLEGVSELTVTKSGERIDVGTRCLAKPFKQTDVGLIDTTFECTVLAEVDTEFTIGKGYTVTVAGASLGELICMTANREEPQAGVITFKLTLKPGLESETDNQIVIGPGEYRGA